MAALDRRLQRLTLAAMCLGQGMILLDNTIVNVALPSIQAELGVTPGNLEWVVDAYPDQRQRTGAIGIWAAAAGLGFSAGELLANQ